MYTTSLVLFYLFFYFFLAVPGLHCCAGSSLVAEKNGGYSLVAVCGLLMALASLVAEHRLQGVRASVIMAHRFGSWNSSALEHKLNSCSTWAQFLHGMWNLPRLGIRLVSPALAGRFSTTKPPGKPPSSCLSHSWKFVPFDCLYPSPLSHPYF